MYSRAFVSDLRAEHHEVWGAFTALNLLQKQQGPASDHQPPYMQPAEASCRCWCCYSGILLPSVAQPPLPLQEFLDLQPLSLALQPPLPLQEFWPLQACFSLTCLSAFLSWDWSCAVNEDLVPESRLDAWIVAPLPASNPASAAPAIKAFFDLVIVLKLTPFIRLRYTTVTSTLCLDF